MVSIFYTTEQNDNVILTQQVTTVNVPLQWIKKLPNVSMQIYGKKDVMCSKHANKQRNGNRTRGKERLNTDCTWCKLLNQPVPCDWVGPYPCLWEFNAHSRRLLWTSSTGWYIRHCRFFSIRTSREQYQIGLVAPGVGFDIHQQNMKEITNIHCMGQQQQQPGLLPNYVHWKTMNIWVVD